VRNALADRHRALSPKHDQSALAGRTLASTEESRGDLDIRTDAVQDQAIARIAHDQDLAPGRAPVARPAAAGARAQGEPVHFKIIFGALELLADFGKRSAPVRCQLFASNRGEGTYARESDSQQC
jgi:hypothetical protein